jgi:hypothetical protein
MSHSSEKPEWVKTLEAALLCAISLASALTWAAAVSILGQ